MATRYTNTEGAVIKSYKNGRAADQEFKEKLRAELNSRDPQKQVNCLEITVAKPENADWTIEEEQRNGDWKVAGHLAGKVTWFKPSTPVSQTARIDTAMDGGTPKSTGMLRRP